MLAALFLGCGLYLLIRVAGGYDLTKVDIAAPGNPISHVDALPWLIVSLLSGTTALVGWALATRRLAAADADRRARIEAEQREQERTRELEELRDHGRRREQEHARELEEQAAQRREEQEDAQKREASLKEDAQEREAALEKRALETERLREAEHQQRARMERGWRSQRDWNRELREQVLRLHHEHGVLGRFDDVRQMILHVTLTLVEGEKGMLLTRPHADAEGPFTVVCAEGFEHDPQQSALAQRFAQEVIERDRTLRENVDDGGPSDERRGGADEEVHNLLAIPIYLQDQFAGVVMCANRKGGFDDLDDDVLLAVGDHAGAVLENSRLHGDLRNAYLATVRMLAEAIEVKDPQLRGHSDSVSAYVMAVADRMEFEPRRREELIFGSLLHDVGKLGISERILLKPGRLTEEERGVIQLHPRIGYHLVSQIPALAAIAPAVLHHHERFDGDGYPARLRGDEIPMEARIIAVADAFSAMTLRRTYSEPMGVEQACEELERCAGSQFDPEVVRLFCREVRQRPPTPDAERHQAVASDPELQLRRDEGEVVLGSRSFGITDSLTLLYSHRHLHESAAAEAQRAAVQGRSFAVILGKLTDLTEVNLRQGYGTGDALLQTAAAAFQEAAVRCQGLAFRASGSSSALLADGMDVAGADQLAAEIQREIEQTTPIRVATAAWRPGEDGEEVIRRARRLLNAPEAPSTVLPAG